MNSLEFSKVLLLDIWIIFFGYLEWLFGIEFDMFGLDREVRLRGMSCFFICKYS